MSTPIVSICCITYNHAPFIKKCLDGFLMQERPSCVTDADEPWYEILIHDDASTDGTADIIREYETNFPDLIKPIYETVNQYQNGHKGEIDFYNYKRACGKYIAYCEGDDYWTDAFKLRKQVDFMESHPDYNICFHLARIYETKKDYLRPLYYDFDKPIDEDEDITPEYFLRVSVGQPLSMVFRKDCYDYAWQKHYSGYCDTHEIYHILRTGKGRLMKFIGGQYNLHSHGESASKTTLHSALESSRDYVEMYVYTKDYKVLFRYCKNTVLWCRAVCAKEKKMILWWRLFLHILLKSPKLAINILGTLLLKS